MLDAKVVFNFISTKLELFLMFGLQEQTLNILLASLKNGDQTGPEAQKHLVRLAVLSQNNPTAPIPRYT